MNILVLGSEGMAGHMITRYLIEAGHNVTGFAKRSSSSYPTIIGDACRKDVINLAVHSDEFDAVINCIGLLNSVVDKNISKGIYINAYLPHYLADILQNTRTKLIHLSTDCVFQGNTGPYKEDSVCDGTSSYDRTKALGEVVDDKNLTFRMSIIGPDRNENGIGLFHWFMKQDSYIQGYTNAIWTGVTTLTLAKAIEKAILDDLCGLYHLVNSNAISKYDLCQLFNYYFKNNSIDIRPYDEYILDKTLINTRTDFDFVVPSYEKMVMEMRDWILTHSWDYPLYIKYLINCL